jgi:hypothetical protein
MALITPAQTNFNAGELSRRLHARFDLAIYDIGVAELTGWVPLPEGGLDACPGTLRVAGAKGPCRLVPFEFNATQGYVVEMSADTARFYTNDARIEAGGEPVEVALPYDMAAIGELAFEQSYDVLYLFHGEHQTRQLVRTSADTFELERVVLVNGPFEPRNSDRSIVVSTNGVSGDVEMTASAAIFAAGDVGGLFQIEADDFGDIASWEPGITVTVGQLLTWRERVYRVAGGSGRTGTVAPIHHAGIEWDGIGAGTDINDNAAGGVQLEFVCDRFGILRITSYTSPTEVSATVLRRLPFTASSSYTYDGGYYDPDSGEYVPPAGSVDYAFGTWRWRFGAFSDRRGWPTNGVVWNERLVLAKGSTVYGGVAGDLLNHATYNEQGDISADMAFVATLSNPNPIVALVADEKLLVLNGSGMFALGPSNAASGVGPGNLRVDRQNNEGAARTMPVLLDGRTLYVGRSRRRVVEGDYALQRDRQDAIDLSRYARHIGKPGFVALASQKDPNRLVWALRGDGTLACAAYLPAEQVLGWATRPLAAGIAARSIATITDPAGELDQLWIAAEWNGGWHVLRLDQFRQEADDVDPAMTDLAAEFDGDPATSFGPVAWLAGRTVDVQADDAVYADRIVGGDGMVTIPNPAGRVRAGLRFPARFTTLPTSGGSDNGAALGKSRRISRIAISVLDTRGLRVTVQNSTPRDIEQLLGDSVANAGFVPFTGVLLAEDMGTHDRFGQITVERVAATGATVRAICPTLDAARA